MYKKILSAFLLFLIVSIAAEIYLTTKLAGQVMGFEDLPDRVEVMRFLTMFIGSFLGILSSILLSRLSAGGEDALLDTRALLMAVIISPVVMVGIYTSVVALSSGIMTFLLCFQNGFFWETTLQKTTSRS
jgi:hypothetical protein